MFSARRRVLLSELVSPAVLKRRSLGTLYRLTICIRYDDAIRPNTNRLFWPLFGIKANTNWIFGTSLAETSFPSTRSLQIFINKTKLAVLSFLIFYFFMYDMFCFYHISFVSCYHGSVNDHSVLLLLINLIWFEIHGKSWNFTGVHGSMSYSRKMSRPCNHEWGWTLMI